MTMLRLLCTVLALAAAVVAPQRAGVRAAQLKPSDSITPENLLADFARLDVAGVMQPGCPAVISHDNASIGADGVISVPHADIRMDGPCASNGNFTIVRPEMVTDLPEVQQALAGIPDAPATLDRLLEMASGELLVGLERGTARVCEGGVFAPNTLFFFSRVGVDVPSQVSDLVGDIALGDTIMFVISFNQSTLCPYVSRASRAPGSGSGNGTGSSDSGSGGGTGGGASSEDGPVCFPAAARVRLADGREKALSELELGEAVAVGADTHSEVFLFTHRRADGLHDFVRLSTPAGALVASPGHYVYLNGKLAAAATARVGDVLTRGDGSPASITRVEPVRAPGLYNPQTLHGDIVVDGFRASTYTTAVRPALADALLAPLRALHRLGLPLRPVSALFDRGAGPLARWAPKGLMKYP